MVKTAFFTVFYPTEHSYHEECIDSLRAQTNHEFDLFIVNDGVKDLDSFIANAYPYPYEILSFEGDMFQIRKHGLNYLLEKGYEYIVLGDSDDYFSKNRIEVSLTLLEKHNLVINDVSLVTSDSKPLKENYFEKRLTNNFLFQRSFLDDKNIVGFSNTAIKSSMLKNISFECSSAALDWFIFTQVMDNSKTEAIFTTECHTFYRQHENNTAAIDIFTKEKFVKGLELKYQHYKSLKGLIEYYKSFYKQAEELWTLCKNDEFCNKYFNELSTQNIINPFWWERIKLR